MRVEELSDSDPDENDTLTATSSTISLLQHARTEPKTMEVFSGTGKLSKAFARQGADTWEIDLKTSEEWDMSDNRVSEAITHRAIVDHKDYCHIAIPCNSYSVARYPRIRTLMQFIISQSVVIPS